MAYSNTVSIASNADVASFAALFERQQQHQYAVGRTTASERLAKLQRLYDCIWKHRTDIEAAMWADLRKSPTEVTISELGCVLGEMRYAMKHLRSWLTPRSVGTPITLFGSSTHIRYESKGVCLIISPWNFPFNLTFTPLIAAIAGGNCCMIKPSEYTVHSSALMKKIIAECFPPEEIVLLEGDASVSQALLELPFNHIFFTGSPTIGKVVMTAAAKHLASVTLELGGKSPVIVDETADLDNAATKIAWLNAMNAGQICIAPDYLLVHEKVKEALIDKIIQQNKTFYGDTYEQRKASPDLCRIISDRHFSRQRDLIDDAVLRGGKVLFGGKTDTADRFVDPTVLTDVPLEARIWEEEIFGPILPIRSYATLDEAVSFIQNKPHALAMYIFSKRKANINRLIQDTRNGAVAINDCAIQFYNSNAPFGGVNNSGIGMAHGEYAFHEFTHARTIIKQARFISSSDLMKPPYGGKLAKWLLEGVVRWF